MPRYFYHVTDPRFPQEPEGIELRGLEQAREQAVRTAGEMLKDLDGRFWGAPEWQMTVTDETGATVCSLVVRGE